MTPKGPQMARDGQKWPGMGGNVRGWLGMAEDGQKSPGMGENGRGLGEMAGNGWKWPRMGGNGLGRPGMAGNGREMADHISGTRWTICERSKARSACAPRFFIRNIAKAQKKWKSR